MIYKNRYKADSTLPDELELEPDDYVLVEFYDIGNAKWKKLVYSTSTSKPPHLKTSFGSQSIKFRGLYCWAVLE